PADRRRQAARRHAADRHRSADPALPASGAAGRYAHGRGRGARQPPVGEPPGAWLSRSRRRDAQSGRPSRHNAAVDTTGADTGQDMTPPLTIGAGLRPPHSTEQPHEMDVVHSSRREGRGFYPPPPTPWDPRPPPPP